MKKYDGFFVTQRQDANAPLCFAFYAYANDVLEWASINRISERPDGIQRILRESRVRAIKRFFESSLKNVIPNNVLVAFSADSVTITQGTESEQCPQVHSGHIEFDESSAEISLVDGQHRLFGMASFDEEPLPVLVVAILNVDSLEQAFQFVVVNNKAVKVPTVDVKSIIAENLDESALIERLMAAGVAYGKHSPMLKEINDLEGSPFHDLLDWDFNRNGEKLIPVTAIEQSVKYLRDAFSLQGDDDSVLDIFCSVWAVVAESYPGVWGNGDSNLMKKVSLNAFNQALIDRLKLAYEMSLVDIFSTSAVKSQVSAIVTQIPEMFWANEWGVKIQDNANVRELIKNDISQIMQNNKRAGVSWSEDLTLITNT